MWLGKIGAVKSVDDHHSIDGARSFDRWSSGSVTTDAVMKGVNLTPKLLRVVIRHNMAAIYRDS
jgi:hypothetical protein